MRFDLLHPADQLVMMMNRIYYRGMTTTSGGNLSIKDDDGSIWITPSGIDKGNLTRDDIMRVLPDGSFEGRHKPSSEYPFHLSVFGQRPDFGAVLHAHSPGLVACSIVRCLPEVLLTPDIFQVCGEVAIAPYALPGSALLGENIAAEFRKGFSAVMLENHGVVIGAADIFRAFMIFETLETAARFQINALKLGTPKALSLDTARQETALNVVDYPEMDSPVHTSEEKALRRDLVKFIHRSYEQGLFTSTQGTYSARLSDGGFIITPYGKDRMYLESEDLVLIRDGCREKGKAASRATRLHEEIYNQHPDISSILIAQPPNLMAFAITDAVFDPRTIPESYILLRDIHKVPFGMTFLDRAGTAYSLSSRTPALICENDCVIVTGKSLMNAFDRLEVAEFSAKSIIESVGLGPIVHIPEKDISDIDSAFNLHD
jgi:L-fuculose-phosphate aldolase